MSRGAASPALIVWAVLALPPRAGAQELPPILGPDRQVGAPGVTAADGFGTFAVAPAPGVEFATMPEGLPPGALLPDLARIEALRLNRRALAELAQGEYDQAIADFDEALRANPLDPPFATSGTTARLLYNRAVAHWNRGNVRKAEDQDKITQAMEKQTRAIGNLMVSNLSSSVSGAIAGGASQASVPTLDVSFLLGDSPSSAEADYQRALADLFHSLLREPARMNAYLVRARVYCQLNEIDKARDDYNTVLRQDPNHGDARRERDALPPAEVAPTLPQKDKSPGVTPAAVPVTPPPTALELALQEAVLAETALRLENARAATEEARARTESARALADKARLDAESFRRQRDGLAKQPK